MSGVPFIPNDAERLTRHQQTHVANIDIAEVRHRALIGMTCKCGCGAGENQNRLLREYFRETIVASDIDLPPYIVTTHSLRRKAWRRLNYRVGDGRNRYSRQSAPPARRITRALCSKEMALPNNEAAWCLAAGRNERHSSRTACRYETRNPRPPAATINGRARRPVFGGNHDNAAGRGAASWYS